MKHQVIHTDNAPAAIGPYSQAVKAGDMLFRIWTSSFCTRNYGNSRRRCSSSN